jgi:putative tricarboxylic transport membrane protein
MSADVLLQALALVFDPYVLWVILGSAMFGLFVGAVPGLTATMATALLVPVTFFMPPVPAIASIVTATAMAIFAGDIPSCFLRMPGTPASAAYTDEAYAMTKKGQGELALGSGLVFSVIGGLFGTAVLIIAAPALAEVALKFSSFEYFWLVVLGLSSAVFLAIGNPLKGVVSLLLGLLVSSVGLDNPAGHPRFTFGNAELAGGLTLIPIMIGMFAVSEILRGVAAIDKPWEMAQAQIGNVFGGMWGLIKKYPVQTLRGSALGTAIGALPGAGADIAAWMSYAVSKRFSKEPEKFGTGHVEGLVEAGASNNASIASGWVPSLLFGIPGDTIAAIAIGVLYMKGLNPGPTLFTEKASSMYAIYLMFIIANLLMIPLGIVMIRLASYVLRAPRASVMPVIMLCCAVGSFAIGNNMFGVVTVATFGIIGYVMEENGYPVAAMVLGIVMGTMVEQAFVTSLIKSDGSILPFFERPISAILAAMAIGAMIWPVLVWLWRRLKPASPATVASGR